MAGTRPVPSSRWSIAVAWIALGAASLAVTGFGPLFGLLVGFALLTPLERRFARHPQRVRRPGLVTDIAHFLFTGLLNSGLVVVGAIAGTIAVWPLRNDGLHALVSGLPVWATLLATLVVFNVAAYWHHRLSHRVGWMWRFHSVHHSSAQLDWVAAARLHPFEGLTLGLMIAPFFAVAGVRPVALGAVSVAMTAWAIVLHANLRWQMRWLEPVVATPEYHRWHHERDVTDRNFAGLLPVLDTVFGTRFRPGDRRPGHYGIDSPMAPTWFGQMLWPLRRPTP